MRVLLATDGSRSASAAATFVAERRWPDDTRIEVLGVMDAVTLLPPLFTPTPGDVQPLEDALQDQLSTVTRDTAAYLEAHGLQARATVLTGRPVDTIIDEAVASAADLVVCGSRGHGELRSLVLGSVSAGVAEHAPCPVLVVRETRLGRALLADDGSDAATAAEAALSTWPMFEHVPIDVITVAYLPPLRSTFGMFPAVMGTASYDDGLRDVRRHAEAINDAAVARLTAAGRRADRIVREGDPAEVIVSQADALSADLVIVGADQRSGLERLALGSVTHAVLMHAHPSVLVVRRVPERARPSADQPQELVASH
jgi:nucleotide-binding universal stress UspA family protein